MPWVIGAALSILGSVASNLGVNIQKYSFIRQSQREPHERVIHWKDVYWLAGLGLVILGSLGDFAALSMVAQSIVAPLASVTLVTNVFFAHFWLHEQVGRRELAGTGLIILGSTLAVVFGDHTTRSYTNHDLVGLIAGGWFLTYAVLVVALCVAGYMLHRRVTPIKKNLVDAIRRYEIAVEAADAQGADWEDEVIARLEGEYKRWEKIHPFALCALSGAFGAQSVLFGKCFAELLSTSLQGDNQFFHIFPYVTLFAMGATVSIQLHFLAVALNYFDSLYCIPVFQCFFIGVSTLGGALYFREVYDMAAGEAFAFVIGLLMTLAGVAVLSTRRMSQRNMAHKLQAGAAATAAGDASAAHARTPLTAQSIPEGDEEAGDDQVVLAAPSAISSAQELLLRRASLSRAGSMSTPDRLRPRSASSSSSSDATEFEMGPLGGSRRVQHAVLKSSSALPGFAEKAEQEARELADVAGTIEATSSELAQRVAQAAQAQAQAASSSASPSSPAAESPMPLLAPSSAAAPPSPALQIQIQADQAYLNNRAEAVAATPHSTYAQSKVAKAAAAAEKSREQSDLDILTMRDPPIPLALLEQNPSALGGTPQAVRSASFAEGASAAAAAPSSLGGSGASTPKSSYATMRSRAASVAGASAGGSGGASAASGTSPSASGPGTPHLRQGSIDRSAAELLTSPSSSAAAAAASASAPSSAAASASMSTPSQHGPLAALRSLVSPELVHELVQEPLHALSNPQAGLELRVVAGLPHGTASALPALPNPVPPSAMFSGAMLDSAQLLPDVENDTRLQRLTRLTHVGHWVGGLHAQMPVVGGVAQAILHAKEMQAMQQSMADSERAKESKDVTAADAAGGEEERLTIDVATSPQPPGTTEQAQATAAAASSSSAAASSSISSNADAARSEPVNRVIEFKDAYSYDPFATQPSHKLMHRDPFRDADLSPTATFAALKPQPLPSALQTDAVAPSSSSNAAAASSSSSSSSSSSTAAVQPLRSLFSPLSSTSHHPLQEGAQPSPPPESQAQDDKSTQQQPVAQPTTDPTPNPDSASAAIPAPDTEPDAPPAVEPAAAPAAVESSAPLASLASDSSSSSGDVSESFEPLSAVEPSLPSSSVGVTSGSTSSDSSLERDWQKLEEAQREEAEAAEQDAEQQAENDSLLSPDAAATDANADSKPMEAAEPSAESIPEQTPDEEDSGEEVNLL